VAGEIVFDRAYENNPLVNAMCVGLLHEDDLIRAKAEGVGNPIIAVGARTGRDGIHGASFALKISPRQATRSALVSRLAIRSRKNCCSRRAWS